MLSECLKLGENNLLKVQFNDEIKEFPGYSKYAVKQNGGEIALNFDDPKKSYISIYNSAGDFINSVPISSGAVAELGWSFKEELLELVFSDGRFQVFSDNLRDFTEVLLLEDNNCASEEIVLEAKFLGDESISILTSENNFITLDLNDMSKFKYAKSDCLEFNTPQSWLPVSDRSIVFALNSCLFKITTEDELFQKQLGCETICHLDLDQKSGDLLVITSDYKVLVVNAHDFNVKLEVDVRSNIDVFAVSSINWFLDSTTNIAAISSSSLGKINLLDVTDGTCLQVQFPKNFLITQEPDGLRIYQNGQNWLLVSIPQIINDLTLGKSETSNYYEKFITNNFDEIKQMSNVKLSEIIEIGSKSVFSMSYEAKLQETFISSIKLAMKVLDEKLGDNENSRHTFSYVTANFKRSLIECDVLTKLHEMGIFISPDEFKNNTSIKQILNRLCRSNLHGFGFEIAILLESDISVILMDWTKKVIETSEESDIDLWMRISDKLFTWGKQQKYNGIDFIQLAEVCIKGKRPKLALKLVKLEKDTRRKIELLVQLNEYREAVIESVQSGKKDQVKYIFDYLAKRLSLTEFFNLSNISESVTNSLNSYCKQYDKVMLQILMYQDDKLNELLDELMISSFQGDNLENLEKWFQLLRTQRIFERRYGFKLVGYSMSETLQQLGQFDMKKLFQSVPGGNGANTPCSSDIEKENNSSSRHSMSSKSFYSRSMGPSIEELKASAASRVESLRSPSSTSFIRGSSSVIDLNLPNEPKRTKLNVFGASSAFDSHNFPSPSGGSPPSHQVTPQENLRTTAQTINGLIQKDKIQSDLGELLNGQFSREYIYGEEHRPIIQFSKHSLIPEILLNQVRHIGNNSDSKDGNNCFMGLFPEIRRAWLTAGNALYLWSFENNRDFTHYLKSQYEIIDVALVRPRAGIFSESVEWIVVVVTPMEIVLLATIFKSPDHSGISPSIGVSNEPKNYSALDLVLCDTGLTFPSDEVNMVSVCGTNDGRIFLAGSDGNIYELLYQEKSDWFSPKCKKINRTASPLSYIVPTFLRPSPSRACVVKLNYDASRNIIYGLTEQSTIHVYWLGSNGQEFEFAGVTGDLSSEAMKLTPAGIISSSKSLNIVSIYPVDASESDLISLVAICRSGIRLYFSIIGNNMTTFNQPAYQTSNVNQQRFSTAPRGIRLAHLRAPPEENRVRDPKKLVHRWSPNIHSALYSSGVTMVANTISNDEDLILGMIINPSVGSASSSMRLPLEYSVEIAIDGKVWAIEELPSLEIPIDSEIKGLGKEFALAHLSPRRSFAVLTNIGIYIYSKLRPVDQLLMLLSESNIPWDQLEKFFDAYGFDQACAFCISLSCRTSEARWGSSCNNGYDFALTFNSNVISVLLKFGGQPTLIDSHQDRNVLSSRNLNGQFREGIGRIIATQPEFENSPMHEGFYIFFSRLISSIWKRSIWDFKTVPGHLIMDLSRFNKFLSDNMASFTEKRGISGTIASNAELSQRLHDAIEFENDSLLRLKEVSGLLIELLTFLSICVDYKLLESVRSETIGLENTGMNIELLLTSSKGKSLITELGNTLVQKQLRLHAPIRPLCENLRSRCSSFFSEEDVFLQEGLEALERARLCRSPIERAENIVEALSALKKASKVIPIVTFYQILDTLDSLGTPDSSLSLALHFVHMMDPENIGLRRENNSNLQLNSDENEICRQRELIYDRLMESLASTGFDIEKTSVIQANNPNLNFDVLREKFLRLAAASKDELFHYRMYEWLVKHQYSQTLLDLPQSEFLDKYLSDTFNSRDNSHRDLRWKWLARSHKYSEAASVLALIAETCEYQLSLSERIEYISLAITHCKSAALDNNREFYASNGFDGIAKVDLGDLETRLDVAHTQYEVLKEAKYVMGGRNEIVCAELDGLVGLLSVSDLFHRYAQPYGLTESCLRLMHISGTVNERMISQLWLDIISKYVNSNNSDRSSFHQLGAKITELARKFYPSPNAFPLAHLIDVLGRLAIDNDIGADWLVAILINAGIPLTALADEFHRFVTSPPSKTWFNSPYRSHLLQMVAILFNIWCKDRSKVTGHNAMIVSRLKAYAIAADEIQEIELMNEFGMLLKHLATN